MIPLKTYIVAYISLKDREMRLRKVVMRANNIQFLFSKIKYELANPDVYWIEAKYPNNKNKLVYSKFYKLDKKTGIPTRLKQNVNTYYCIKSKNMVGQLILQGRLKDAYLMSRYYFTFTLPAYIRAEFRHQKAIIEKYLIKNGFPVLANVVNNSRITEDVKENRQKHSFNLRVHLSKMDISLNTVGCGCNYCKISYHKHRYELKYKAAYSAYKLFISKTKTHRNPHENHNDVPLSKLGISMKVKKLFIPINEYWNKTKEFDKYKKQLERTLQIPKDARL